jgi:hypothetical protein
VLKQLAVLAVLVVIAVVTIDELADQHQTRPERVPLGSTSEVVFDVEMADGYHQTIDVAAQALYAACAGTTTRTLVEDEGFRQVAPGRFRFVVEPALGDNNELKLTGCLQDLTVDRVLGNVVSVTQHDP